MSGSKIRSIAIVVLILINGLFLGLIISDATEDARAQRESLENISTILINRGIMISPDNIRTDSTIRAMRTARAVEMEQTIARVFLGDTVVTDQGVIFSHENPEKGSALFYSAGHFGVRLNEGVITSESDSKRTVIRLLEQMGLETDALVTVYNRDSNTEVITVLSAYRGVSIFNCPIEFVFVGENLSSVDGRFVSGIEPIENGAEISHVGAALLAFLSAVKDEDRHDVSCTEIFEVQAGFRYRGVGAAGEGVIDPAWRVRTDNGVFMIDDATGEIWVLE